MPALNVAALLRALAVWLVIILAESAQGAMRRALIDPQFEFVVRQVSVITGAAVILAITWICRRWMRIGSAAEALLVGVLWVVLTLVFELALGLAAGESWSRICADYDLAHGGMMPVGLLFMAVTPWIVRAAHSRRQST